MPLYETSTLGTSSNQITFNDFSGPVVYRAIRRTPAKREIAEFDIKLPEGSGIADFQSFIGREYLVIDGIMYPNDEAGFDNGRKALRKLADMSIEQDDADSDQGYVPYKWHEYDGYDKQMWLKVQYVDLPESTKLGLKQPFKIVCKVKYPVMFDQNTVTAQIGSSTSTTSGSSGLPFGLPLGLGSTTYSSTGTITNQGDIATYPNFQIFGPITTPRLTNNTTNQYIELNITLTTGSDSVVINYDQDSLSVTQAGNSVLANLTSGSALFKITPGANDLRLSGASVGDGAYATVSMNSAWPIS